MPNLHEFTIRSLRQWAPPKQNKSIHPYGRSGKSNTCKPKSQSVLQRVRAGLEEHLKRHPRDAVSAGHLAKLGK